jgi:hypothetical protein
LLGKSTDLWLRYVILATWEADIGRIAEGLGQIVHETPHLQNGPEDGSVVRYRAAAPGVLVFAGLRNKLMRHG